MATNEDDDIMNEQEKEEEEESLSSSSSENDELEGIRTEGLEEQEPEWRKGKLSTSQYTLLKIENLLNSDMKTIIFKSEEHMLRILSNILSEINSVQIAKDHPQPHEGNLIMKGLTLVNQVSNHHVICMRRPAVTDFMGKVFEYLETVKVNPVACLGILRHLSRTHFDSLNDTKIEEVITTKSYLKFILEDVIEMSTVHPNDLIAGKEPLRLCYKFLLGIIQRVNRVYAGHFDLLKETMHTNKLDLYSSKGLYFRRFLIPYKKLRAEDVAFMAFDLRTALKTDYKLSQSHILRTYSNLIKNKHFKLATQDVETIFKEIPATMVEYSKTKNSHDRQALIHVISSLLSHMVFKPSMDEHELTIAVNGLEGFLDTIVDEFHPKSTRMPVKQFYQHLIKNFLSHYVREAKKSKKKNFKQYEIVRSTVHPVLKKIINFCIFDSMKPIGFEKGLMALCSLDKDVFADYILNKIRFCFDFEEFKKTEVVKYLASLSDHYINDENMSHHLSWIIPKLLQQLQNSADDKSVSYIAATLNSIFENFVDEDLPKTKAHLSSFRDAIDEAALEFIRYCLKKAESYTIAQESVQIVMSISDYTKKKFSEEILELIRRGFDKVSRENTQVFLIYSLKFMRKETEAALLNWLDDNVFSSCDVYHLSNLTFGASLLSMGLNDECNVKIGSSNESALVNYVKILEAAIEVCLHFSENLRNKIILALCILSSNDIQTVAKAAGLAITKIFAGLRPYIENVTSNSKVLETTNDKQGCSSLKWKNPEKEHPELVSRLVKAFVFQPLDTLRELLAKMKGQRKIELDPIVQLYRDTLAEKQASEQSDESESGSKASVNRITELLRVICCNFDQPWIQANYLRSNKLQSLTSTLKRDLLDFFTSTGKFNHPRLRQAFESLVLIDIKAANFAIQGEVTYVLYMKALKGYSAYFKELEGVLKSRLAELVVYNHLPLYSYFEGSAVDFDKVQAGPLQERIMDCELGNAWIYGGHLEQRFIGDSIKSGMEFSVFFSVDLSKALFDQAKSHLARWLKVTESDLRGHLLDKFNGILDLDQTSSEKYSTTAKQISMAGHTFFSRIYVQEHDSKLALLDLAAKIAKKGDFGKISSTFFQITNYLLKLPVAIGNDNFDAGLDDLIHQIKSKDDESLTFTDLMILLTKMILNYPTWSVKQRALIAQTLILKMNSKNINKRILIMSYMFFMVRLIKAADYEEEIVFIDNKAFANDKGFVGVEVTAEVFTEVQKKIGYSVVGSSKLDEKASRELEKITPDLYPKAAQYLSLPLQFVNVKRRENTQEEFRRLVSEGGDGDLIDSFVYFTKMVIQEYSDTVDEKNLSIQYSYVERLVLVDRPKSISRESSIFASFRLVSSMLGYEGMRKAMKRLDEEVEEKNAEFVKVKLILLSSLLVVNASFTDSEFDDLLSLAKQMLVPLMNMIDQKTVNFIHPYIFMAAKSAFNFKRSKLFYDMLIEAMIQDKPDNKNFYFDLLMLNQSNASLIPYPAAVRALLEVAKDADHSQLANVKAISKLFTGLLPIRYLASFTLQVSPGEFETLESRDLTSSVHVGSHLTIGDFASFIDKLKSQNIIARMECMKYAVMISALRSVDSQNLEFTKLILSVLFTLDPNENLGVTQLINLVLKGFEMSRDGIEFIDDTSELLLEYLESSFDSIKSNDCLKTLIKMVKRGVGSRITPKLDSMIVKLSRDSRIPLRESIESAFRHDIFERLPNQVIYGYAKDTFNRIDSAVKAK